MIKPQHYTPFTLTPETIFHRRSWNTLFLRYPTCSSTWPGGSSTSIYMKRTMDQIENIYSNMDMKNQERSHWWAFMGRIHRYIQIHVSLLRFMGSLVNSSHVTRFASWYQPPRTKRVHQLTKKSNNQSFPIFCVISSHFPLRDQKSTPLKQKKYIFISRIQQSHKQKGLKNGTSTVHPPAWASFDCKLLFRSSTGPIKQSWMNRICLAFWPWRAAWGRTLWFERFWVEVMWCVSFKHISKFDLLNFHCKLKKSSEARLRWWTHNCYIKRFVAPGCARSIKRWHSSRSSAACLVDQAISPCCSGSTQH